MGIVHLLSAPWFLPCEQVLNVLIPLSPRHLASHFQGIRGRGPRAPPTPPSSLRLHARRRRRCRRSAKTCCRRVSPPRIMTPRRSAKPTAQRTFLLYRHPTGITVRDALSDGCKP